MDSHHFDLEKPLQNSSKARTIGFGITAAGLLLLIIGYFVAAPEARSVRFWSSFLLGDFYFTAISITAVLWMAVSYVAKAGWAVGLKRIHEAIGGYFIIGGIGIIIMIIAGMVTDNGGMKAIYEWTHLDPKGFLHVEGKEVFDRVLLGKRSWLNLTAFLIRQIIYFGVWFWFYRVFRKNSLEEDKMLTLKYYNSSYKLSAGFLPFYGVTFCLFSYDWAMSLEPHWYSTMYGVNVFAGALVSMFTLTSVIAFILKKDGQMGWVNENHFHDNGKLMFGFSIFWTYTWVGQFLLIWYANLPEEVPYFYTRMHDNWAPLFWLNLILNFVVPFILLMMRNSKRNYNWLIFVGCLMLIGRFIDWFLLIMPGAAGDMAHLGLIEIGAWLFFAGVFSTTVIAKLAAAPLAPVNHPFMEESLHHEI
jgi:hypothetical protein